MITGSTYKEVPSTLADESIKYHRLLISTIKNIHWIQQYTSFEQYYKEIQQAINFFSEKENFEACSALKTKIDFWIDAIPKNIDEAIKFLIDSTPPEHLNLLQDRSTIEMAIMLHRVTGHAVIDLWLLNTDVSPIKEYYKLHFNITDIHELVNDVLKKYIQTLKESNTTN